MNDRRRADWDERHARRGPDTRPASALLRSLEDRLPRVGKALDVAGGAGRNALWLARRGLAVTLADFSTVALRHARDAADAEGLALATVAVDLEADGLPEGCWDVIICINFLWRPLYAAFAARLARGGWLVIAHPTAINRERHESPGERHLLRPGELSGLVGGGGRLIIEAFDEDWRDDGRHEAWLVARAPV